MLSADTVKIHSKLTKLDKSLDELEAQLEPLLAQPLPETLLALDTIQQAKLQVIVPYVVYDLVFVYLKSRGVDPKAHRVVAELERVRQYFDKIKYAEDVGQQRKLGIDKEAAGRFIRQAIAQAKNAELIDDPSGATIAASSSSNHGRVPLEVTGKMVARAGYEEELEKLESEEEDGIGVFDDEPAVEDDEAMDTPDNSFGGTRFTRLENGKEWASEDGQFKGKKDPSSRRKRPRVDPFSGYENVLLLPRPSSQETDRDKKADLVTPVLSPGNDSSRGASVSTSDDRRAKRIAKGARRKEKKS